MEYWRNLRTNMKNGLFIMLYKQDDLTLYLKNEIYGFLIKPLKKDRPTAQSSYFKVLADYACSRQGTEVFFFLDRKIVYGGEIIGSEDEASFYLNGNTSPLGRNVYFEKLKQNNYKNSYIENLFRGSGSYINVENNYFDCLIADEAHHLNAKSGIFQNLDENQIKEIIHASKVSVFFIDENQIVITADIGPIELINKYAKEEGSAVYSGDEINLVSQFRFNGSDGYLAFLDNLLGIRETANTSFDIDYDINLFDSPSKMRDALREKNAIDNKSRMLAGYCYRWITKNNPNGNDYDINLEDDFHAKWNFENTTTWAIDENSFEQVGCIHTSQGLEFDYCGVIIGKDLFYQDGVKTDFMQRAKGDKSIKGIKTTKNYYLADKIIRNTYRTLLSRGQKGCYVYCEDKALLKYMSKMLNKEIIK